MPSHKERRVQFGETATSVAGSLAGTPSPTHGWKMLEAVANLGYDPIYQC